MNYSYGPPTGVEAARLADGVGRMIREERERLGWSKAELKRRSGLSTYGYEKGTMRPSWRSLCRLAEAFRPGDRRMAEALALRLAEAAGPSLAGPPNVPTSLSREFIVQVLINAARRVGLDLDDDTVRHVVMDELRLVAGDANVPLMAGPPSPVTAETVLAIEGVDQ